MKQILAFLLALPLCWSCNEIGLTENANDVSYISFVKDMTKDSTALSFKTYTGDVIRIPLEVKLNGYYPETDSIAFTLSADLERTTVPADKYAFDETYWFSPRQLKDTVYIQLTNFPELQTATMRLCVKVNESETVKQGDPNYRRALIDISDRLIRPEWWIRFDALNYYGEPYYNIAEEHYLGKYSEKKYVMFLEELGKDNVQYDGDNVNILRIYSLRLKYRIKAYNDANPGAPMWDDDNNEPMTIPVAG